MRSICVFCGSSSGQSPIYKAQANRLGEYLAQQDIELVYGGAQVGLMGAVADACLAAGGRVFGVIPEHLDRVEIAHRGLTELVVVPDMHTRKSLMAERADGFIALPGGVGTLEELFEVWTWTQLGLHRKPLGVLNVGGFYDGLISFLDGIPTAGFMRQEHRQLLKAADQPDQLIEALRQAELPDLPKWVIPKP